MNDMQNDKHPQICLDYSRMLRLGGASVEAVHASGSTTAMVGAKPGDDIQGSEETAGTAAMVSKPTATMVGKPDG